MARSGDRPMPEQLRVAVVLADRAAPPDWGMRLVTQIAGESSLELCGIIQASDHERKREETAYLVNAWQQLETAMFGKLEKADRASYLASIHDVPTACSADIAALKRLKADVIIDLSPDRGAFISPQLARFGIWFLEFGQKEAVRASIRSSQPTTSISLFCTSEDAAEVQLIDMAVLNPKFLASRNGLLLCEKSVPLAMRALRRTCANGAPDTELPGVEPRSLSRNDSDLSGYLRSLVKHSARRMLNRVRERAHRRPGMFFLKSGSCSWPELNLEEGTSHLSSRNSYYADPFLWERNNELFCFFEEYDYKIRRGHINVGRFENDQLIDIRPVLATDYHVSFPFLFSHGHELFMLPETSSKRRLEVWKCERFPDQWRLHSVALEGVAASDLTLNYFDGQWWLFTNISRDAFVDMNSELHIFRADGPDLAELIPHRCNPVILDSRCARNAGRVLEIDGRRFRPAQDNSNGYYGFGLRLMEIGKLSLDDYQETEVHAFQPDLASGIIGCHHFDMRGGRMIMDFRKRIGGYAG